MGQSVRTLVFAVSLILILIPPTIMAQGICVIAEKRVPELKGIVSFVNQKNVVGDAHVSLRRKSTGKIVEMTRTDKDGMFKFNERYRGRFTLIVALPDAVSLYIPIRVVNSGAGSYLQITLGALVDETCGGGEVKVVKKE